MKSKKVSFLRDSKRLSCSNYSRTLKWKAKLKKKDHAQSNQGTTTGPQRKSLQHDYLNKNEEFRDWGTFTISFSSEASDSKGQMGIGHSEQRLLSRVQNPVPQLLYSTGKTQIWIKILIVGGSHSTSLRDWDKSVGAECTKNNECSIMNIIL